MTRFIIENIFFFLLPTLAYIAFEAYKRNDWPGLVVVFSEAPVIKLFIAGGALMLAAVFLFSTYTGHPPSEGYVPPSYSDGKVKPGHGTWDDK